MYRWWTFGGGRDTWGWWLKLGPVTVDSYRWLDRRLRMSVTVLCRREFILWGGPLT